MARSIPQLISIVAALVGVALFLTTLYVIDLDETVASISRLGAALPIVLVPGTAWHLLRTWGWSIAFPDEYRPAFTRVFRVRLAADAIGFFTVRGVAGEPLKVVLLYDRVPPEVTTAAVALERLAFAVIGIVVAGRRKRCGCFPSALPCQVLVRLIPACLEATRWHPVLKTLELGGHEPNEHPWGPLHAQPHHIDLH